MQIQRWLVVAAVAAAAAGCTRGCGGGESGLNPPAEEVLGEPEKGGRIIVASIGEPSVLLPPLASDSASAQISGLVFDTLIEIGKDLEYEPGIAERWEVSDDGLVLTFFLRKDVKFHDGTPLTADDVVFTYEALMAETTPSPYKVDFEPVERFEKVDDHTVRVTYRYPFAPALLSYAGAFGIMPRHLLQGQPLTQTELRFKPVGSGPYRFASWDKGNRVILTANPDYYKGEPYITQYILRIIPDQATTFLELKAGGVDEMTPTPVQYARQADSGELKGRVNKYDYYGFGYTYLGFNLEHPVFADKRVRRAISMAIDRDELVHGVLLGLGTPASGPYRPDVWYHNGNIKPMKHDPEGAKKLLAEAGFRTVNGRLVKPDGTPFKFEIITNQGNDSRRKTGEIIQRRLSELGIDVTLRTIEWSSFLKEFIDKKNYQAVILGWNSDIDPDQYSIWHSSQTGEGAFNFVSFRNAEVDRLLEEGRREFDQEKRKQIYDRFQEILAEEQPYAFLYVPKSLVLIDRKVKGVELGAAGLGWNFEKWWIPAAQRETTQQ